jgi:hypothetical protein
MREVVGSNISDSDTLYTRCMTQRLHATRPHNTTCATHHTAASRLTISLLEVSSSSCGNALESCRDWPSSATATRVIITAADEPGGAQATCVTKEPPEWDWLQFCGCKTIRG